MRLIELLKRFKVKTLKMTMRVLLDAEAREGRSSATEAPNLPETAIGRAGPLIKRFFHQGDTAEVRRSEMDPADRLRRTLTLASPDEPDAWLNHRMPPTHHVDPLGDIRKIRMGLL